MKHVNTLWRNIGSKAQFQYMAWNCRTDNLVIDQCCGFPLYFQILENTYGIIPAYVYMVYGMIFPYLNNHYWPYELANASELQQLYNNGSLNNNYVNAHTNTSKYYQNFTD